MQIARLAVADKERVEGARAAAAHAYYSQFTFQPAINPKSKQLVRVSLAYSPDSVCSVTPQTHMPDGAFVNTSLVGHCTYLQMLKWQSSRKDRLAQVASLMQHAGSHTCTKTALLSRQGMTHHTKCAGGQAC